MQFHVVMDKSNFLTVTQKQMVVLRSVSIRDGKQYQGTIGNLLKQGLLVMHLAIVTVCIYVCMRYMHVTLLITDKTGV